jgi:hypothetical protein
MRIREENCNMVLLAGVALLSMAVAGAAAWLEPPSAASKGPAAYASNVVAPSSDDTQSVRLADQTPVRVFGTPLVPNTNPRER